LQNIEFRETEVLGHTRLHKNLSLVHFASVFQATERKIRKRLRMIVLTADAVLVHHGDGARIPTPDVEEETRGGDERPAKRARVERDGEEPHHHQQEELIHQGLDEIQQGLREVKQELSDGPKRSTAGHTGGKRRSASNSNGSTSSTSGSTASTSGSTSLTVTYDSTALTSSSSA
jgi:hypothetical protein